MPLIPSPNQAPVVWRVWLGVSAWTSIAGWGLSSLGALGASGYTIAAAMGLALGAFVWKDQWGKVRPRIRRPWRRTAPFLFAVLTGMAFIGGALYAPWNYDTFWYRLPRVLHWLDAGRWHWIATPVGQYNYLANGMEWFHAPLVAWTGSRRGLFLPNIAAFLLLPGLCFAVFRRMGVPDRTAWWWMWLAPSGWVYASQAGSVANDLISAVYALAALEFAFRARRSGRFADIAWSVVAAALLTNTKQTNLPLLLPWTIALLPALPRLKQRPLAALGVTAIAIVISVVPITIANFTHTGHWSGWSRSEQNFVPAHPVFAVVANLALLVLHDVLPPWVPGAASLNQVMTGFAAQHPGWVQGFEFFGVVPTSFDEAWAGPGMFLSLLLIPYLLARGSATPSSRRPRPPIGLAAAIGVATMVLLSQMGCRQPARYLAPYYPLVLALVLRRPAAARIVRRRGWPVAAGVGLLAAIAYVALLKSRPLLPIRPLVAGWVELHPDHWLSHRLEGRMGSWGPPRHPFETFTPHLGSVHTVGFAAVAAGEPYLWDWSTGRRVVQLPRPFTGATLDQLGIEFLVLNDLAALYAGQSDGLAWTESLGGEVVASSPLNLDAVRVRRAVGGLPSIEDLAYQRSRLGTPAVDNFYLVRRPVRRVPN